MAHQLREIPRRFDILGDRVRARVRQTDRRETRDEVGQAVATVAAGPDPDISGPELGAERSEFGAVGLSDAVGPPGAAGLAEPVGLADAAYARPAAEDCEPLLVAEAIAHQLRSTLALISGYSQTLQHLPLDNDVRVRYLERISTVSATLSELTDEMLAVALTPHRAVEPAVEPISLRHLFERLLRQFPAGSETTAIRVDMPTDLPLVRADPIWIGLVVRNLVTNAAKYAQASGVRVKAWQNGEWVVTRVSDDGGGIDADERPHVFEPRFRGRRALETGSQGSGLGLYLCKRLVDAHGGRIWLDDADGGMAVCFSLPRARMPFFLAPPTDVLVAVGPGHHDHRGA